MNSGGAGRTTDSARSRSGWWRTRSPLGRWHRRLPDAARRASRWPPSGRRPTGYRMEDPAPPQAPCRGASCMTASTDWPPHWPRGVPRDDAREQVGGEGSGLGLSIVRAIATAHGATVAAHARPSTCGPARRRRSPRLGRFYGSATRRPLIRTSTRCRREARPSSGWTDALHLRSDLRTSGLGGPGDDRSKQGDARRPRVRHRRRPPCSAPRPPPVRGRQHPLPEPSRGLDVIARMSFPVEGDSVVRTTLLERLGIQPQPNHGLRQAVHKHRNGFGKVTPLDPRHGVPTAPT